LYGKTLTWKQVSELTANWLLRNSTKPKSEEMFDIDRSSRGNEPVEADSPDLDSLDPDCAKIIWYSLRAVFPERVIKGTWIIRTKSFANQKMMERLFSSPEIKQAKIQRSFSYNGTFSQVFDVEENPLRGFAGNWSNNITCWFIKQKEVGNYSLSSIDDFTNDEVDILGDTKLPISLRTPSRPEIKDPIRCINRGDISLYFSSRHRLQDLKPK
jgi:hypothetical protein